MDKAQKSPRTALKSIFTLRHITHRPQILILLCIILGSLSIFYVPFDTIFMLAYHVNDSMLSPPLFVSLPQINNTLLLLHIAGALPAFLMGPLLFTRTILKNAPHLHRRMGKYYMYGAVLSALTVIPLALAELEGLVARIGFTAMGTFWLLTIWFGYSAIRNLDRVAHRRWMMRSYAITLAFLHERITYDALGLDEVLSLTGRATFVSMIGWQFNLLVTEAYLMTTTYTGQFVGWKKLRKNLARLTAPEDKFYFRLSPNQSATRAT